MIEPTIIDGGERWASVLGVACVLSKEIERINAAQKRAAVAVEFEIEKLAKSLCTGGLEPTWRKLPPYKTLSDQLAEQFSESQVEGMISGLPPDDQLPYMTVASRQFEFLSHAFPRSSRETLAGPVPVNPASTAMFRFNWLYGVIDKPLSVFELMSAGALLRNQAHAVRAVFPSLSAAIDKAIRLAIENEKTKNMKYEVPFKADAGIRDWMDLPIVIKPYQVAYIEASKKQESEPEPSKTSKLAPESRNSLSAAQSALYGTVGK